MCSCCQGTGYIVVEVPVFADGGYSDVDQIEAPCHCNPDPTDQDRPSWFDDSGEPYGTASEDFHRFHDRRYAGL